MQACLPEEDVHLRWKVHRLAQEEFLVRTRSQTDEWLDKVYG